MTIDRDTARAIAAETLAAEYEGLRIRVDDAATVEGRFGWVFVYDTADDAETGTVGDGLIAAAPLLVTRDGETGWVSTGTPLADVVAQLDALQR